MLKRLYCTATNLNKIHMDTIRQILIGIVAAEHISDTVWKTNISIFFLSCVALGGIYGALSTDKKIFFVQALPAIIALALVLFT
jgi:uncharacterized membrane protein